MFDSYVSNHWPWLPSQTIHPRGVAVSTGQFLPDVPRFNFPLVHPKVSLSGTCTLTRGEDGLIVRKPGRSWEIW